MKLRKTLSKLWSVIVLRELVAVFWNNYKELVFAPNPLFPELVSLGASKISRQSDREVAL